MRKRITSLLLCFVFISAILAPVLALTHSDVPYDKLKNKTLTISGEGVLKIMTFTVSEIENMEHISASYTNRSGKSKETDLYSGVSVQHFLELAGIKSTAKAVRLTSSNGKILILPIEAIQKNDYVNEVDDVLLTPIFAFSKAETPLVQNEKSEGYAEKITNVNGPLYFIIGQTEKKELNFEKWLPDVTKLEVLNAMPKSRFSDLTSSYMWAEDHIDMLVEKDLMTSVTDTKFNPNGIVTRGEIAKIFVKAFNIPVKPVFKELYIDVDESNPNEPYIRAATEAGLLAGKGDHTFSPDEPITKNEIAIVAVRGMGLSQEASRLTNPTVSFKDAEDIPSWAINFISVAEKNMLFDKNFAYEYYNGKNQVSRAETASIVYRAMKLK